LVSASHFNLWRKPSALLRLVHGLGLRAACLLFLCSPWLAVAAGGPVSLLGIPADVPLGTYATYMRESGTVLSLDAAMRKAAAGQFSTGKNAILAFGLGSRPVWVHLSLINPGNTQLLRQLSIENAWLDQIDIYFVQRQQVQHYELGDSHAFRMRPIAGRFFAVDHRFDPGTTQVFLRIATPDPMVLPIYLMDTEAVVQRRIDQAYGYGFLYGYLLALLAYNLLIYSGLRNKSHLYYAGFIACFLLLNIAYTGHGFAWFWPDSVTLQRWVIPLMMVAYGVTGLGFARSFLDTRSNFPRMHRWLVRISGVFVALLLAAWLVQSQRDALLVAFVFVSVFSFLMLLVGTISLYSGYRYARYFLIASVASMVGTSVTALSVLGLLPFNDWTYRAVEYGMLIDATLLALALSNQFQLIRREHRLAIELAARDPLTGLYNRRSFLEHALPVWRSAQHRRQPLSAIMIDIDHFKSINDQYGHAVGDAALVAVANALTSAAREGDILARWGGEEFLLLLPETQLDAALVMAERLRNIIAEIHLPVQDKLAGFTASLGVSSGTAYKDLYALISKADELLYASKAAGRNRTSIATHK
jgi:diguanylate cyclase (GGDEF)-like protein